MCQTCKNYYDEALAAGATDDQYWDWLWNATPYPFGRPRDTDFQRLLDWLAGGEHPAVLAERELDAAMTAAQS